MRSLSEFLEDRYVQQIINACREYRSVQGILIEIDPRWMQCWRLGESVNPNDPPYGFKEALVDFYHPGLFLEHPLMRYREQPWLPFREITAKDLQWKPSFFWSDQMSNTYSRWPIVMRICLYPRGEERERAAPQFRGEGFRISYEVRPIAQLYSSPKDQHRPLLGGVSVGVNTTDAGTMGGILTDDNGTYYGLTCAHVVGSQKSVEQPAHIDKHASAIGSVVHKQLPPPFPSHARKVPADQAGYAAKVDAALIKFDPTSSAKLEVLKMGPVTKLLLLDDIEQDEELQLTGRTSDWQKVQRSSVSPFYNVKNKTTGDEYCFEYALIFREPSGAAAARPGDSGAWLCREVGPDYHWVGMVVGGDKQLGIAVGSYEIKSWWEAAGFRLRVC
jgi:hypothetical protein